MALGPKNGGWSIGGELVGSSKWWQPDATATAESVAAFDGADGEPGPYPMERWDGWVPEYLFALDLAVLAEFTQNGPDPVPADKVEDFEAGWWVPFTAYLLDLASAAAGLFNGVDAVEGFESDWTGIPYAVPTIDTGLFKNPWPAGAAATAVEAFEQSPFGGFAVVWGTFEIGAKGEEDFEADWTEVMDTL